MYRLPSRAEWELAVNLGGGEAAQVESALFMEDAELHPDEFIELSRPIDEGDANSLGIKNLIGNAAEWVSDKVDGEAQILGGHFMMAKDDFSMAWYAVENQGVWNETYPQEPVSKWWYKDSYFQGFRVVCDPVNIPAE